MRNLYEVFLKYFKREEALKQTQEVDSIIEDKELYSNSQQFADFMENTVWLDMKNTLQVKIKVLRDDLETMSVHNDIIHLQGEIYSMRTMLMLPELIKQDLEDREARLKQKLEDMSDADQR